MDATNSTQAARGTGRYYRRIGLDVTQAVSAAANLYPQLSSADVRRGWNAEASS